MSEKDKNNSSDKIFNILYPGYSDMSQKRKNAIAWRDTTILFKAEEIYEIFEQMKNPESPLYQEGVSDKDIVNIASIYVKIHEECNALKKVPTERMLRGGGFYGLEDTQPEYRTEKKTDEEVLNDIKGAVGRYNATQKITIKNILKGIKKYNINYNTAIEVSEIIKGMADKGKEEITNENKEMEI